VATSVAVEFSSGLVGEEFERASEWPTELVFGMESLVVTGAG
jgi:hypothetical protein